MAMMPTREMDPQVGLAPTVPVNAAGWRADPPVSVPTDSGAWNPARAAAAPPEEPPGTWSRFHGLRVSPKAECSVVDPIANSSRLVLPSTGRPAALTLLWTVDS